MTIAAFQQRRVGIRAIRWCDASSSGMRDVSRPWVEHIKGADHIPSADFAAPFRPEPHRIAELPFPCESFTLACAAGRPFCGFGHASP